MINSSKESEYCKDHACHDILLKKYEERLQDLKGLPERIMGIETILTEFRNLLENYLDQQDSMEQRMSNALDRIEARFQKAQENQKNRTREIESRVQKNEASIDHMKGGILALRWLVGLLLSSGLIGALLAILKR